MTKKQPASLGEYVDLAAMAAVAGAERVPAPVRVTGGRWPRDPGADRGGARASRRREPPRDPQRSGGLMPGAMTRRTIRPGDEDAHRRVALHRARADDAALRGARQEAEVAFSAAAARVYLDATADDREAARTRALALERARLYRARGPRNLRRGDRAPRRSSMTAMKAVILSGLSVEAFATKALLAQWRELGWVGPREAAPMDEWFWQREHARCCAAIRGERERGGTCGASESPHLPDDSRNRLHHSRG